MSEAPRKMLLYCDVPESLFTLTAEGEDWRRTFQTFEHAYEEAEARTTETIPFIICSASGDPLLESTVSPTPSQSGPFNRLLMGRRRVSE